MTFLLQNCVDRGIEVAPLGEQLVENKGAVGGEEVKALLALFFLAPLAVQEPLCFEPAQQGVERAFINLQAMLGESFTQRVAVLLAAQRRQHGQHQAAAAKFEAEVFKGFGTHWDYHAPHPVLHTLCATQYIMSRTFLWKNGIF